MYSFLGIRATKMMNGVGAFRESFITARALRAFLACLEAGAEHEARSHSIRKKAGKVRPPAPTTAKDVYRAFSGSCAPELKQLERAGLISKREGEIVMTETLFSFGDFDSRRSAARLIPVPREMLRALIQETRPAVILTALAYFLYGLSFERGTGEVKRAGAIKATTIAELCGISERSARSARAELIQRGWITRDEASTQWKLNRTGAYFEINCEWRNTPASNPEQEQRRGNKEPRSAQAVDNSQQLEPKSAPPRGQKEAKFAPPIKRPKRFLRNHKDQKGSGVYMETGRGEKPPTIRNIKPEDLREFPRNEALYWQARARGLISGAEADVLNWVAASIRARETENPGAVFMGIIKKRLWYHITQGQEEEARRAINRRRDIHPGAYRGQREGQLLAA